MRYKRAKLVGDNGKCLQISIGEDGSIWLRTDGDVVFKPDTMKISHEVAENIDYIVSQVRKDFAIGETIMMFGVEYECFPTYREDCQGCVFENLKCPDVLCLKDERADRTNIIWRKRKP